MIGPWDLGSSAQAYTNNIINKPRAIPKPFKAQSHFGNTSQPSLIISFIFPFPPMGQPLQDIHKCYLIMATRIGVLVSVFPLRQN